MKTVLIGEKYISRFKDILKSYGYLSMPCPKNYMIDERLAYHSDLSLFIYGKKAICSESILNSKDIVNILTNKGYSIIKCRKKQEPQYPYDVNLCVFSINDLLIFNPDTADEEINFDFFSKIITVKQGYCRCAILGFGDNKIITSDKGIAKSCKNANIEVLCISDTGIDLPGYSNGFIGGASIVDNEYKKIFFTGNIELHPDSNIIKKFINDHGFEIISLYNGVALDIGGGIII